MCYSKLKCPVSKNTSVSRHRYSTLRLETRNVSLSSQQHSNTRRQNLQNPILNPNQPNAPQTTRRLAIHISSRYAGSTATCKIAALIDHCVQLLRTRSRFGLHLCHLKCRVLTSRPSLPLGHGLFVSDWA